MRNKERLHSIVICLVFFFLISISSAASAKEMTVDNDDEADFRSIQEAVTNSSPGDLILVSPESYNESVDIGVQNISILSDSGNPEDTVVRAFKLSANNITLSGFSIKENLALKDPKGEFGYPKIENCTVKHNILESGIGADECYNSTIEKNVILNSGIYVDGPEADSNFTISDNLIVNGDISIHHGSYNCVLLNNTLLNGGIGVGEGPGCKILGNYISNGLDHGSGIVLSESSSNEIENNTIVNCSKGIFIIWLSAANTINNNTLTSNDHGISIGDSTGGNSLLNNKILNNNIGILLGEDSSDNLVMGNVVELNKKYGVYINEVGYVYSYNGKNRFYNNIFNNTVNLFNDTSSSYTEKAITNGAKITPVFWNTTKTAGTNILGKSHIGGNYWAKPDGTGFSQNCNDWNGDGIGDSFYTINAYDVDYLPLVSISKQDQPVFPAANLSANVSSGFVPFSISFTDLSRNATSRIWDFNNDGISDSNNVNEVYTYTVPGTYTVNLTVSNANGTVSRFSSVTASARPQYTLTEVQITSDKSNQTMPAIYGDKTVFLDDRSGWGRYNIYMYDLSTSKETRITTNNSYYNTGPAIYGDRIVWQEFHYNNNPNTWDKPDIHMYDLSISKETQITNSGKAADPSIYGDRIVYVDTRNGNADIYMYDLSTSKETQITTNESWQGYPAIYGDRIVWQDSRNGQGYNNPTDIYMYDISTHKETQITTNNSDQYYPAIYGDRIVWQDLRNNGWDIYIYDLSTLKETQISTDKDDQEYPAIYGDRIVWMDSRNGKGDIYMYDLSTSRETRITTNRSGHSNPAIYGDRIVWEDSRNEYSVSGRTYANKDIYMCTVSEVEQGQKSSLADFSTNITSGYAPLTVQFTALSENATEWKWDFENDGLVDSTDKNTVHVYTIPGTYTVNFTAMNGNNIASKAVTITVLKKSSSGGSSGNSGGSGGAGGSPEPAKNVAVKELSQTFIGSGNPVKFDFPKNTTSVVYLSFDSKKTAGKTTTIVEMLKNKSTLTPDAPEGEVYKYLNIWVGNGGYGTEENIENAVVCFRVEKSWVQNKNVDQSSITLSRYSDKKWNQLPTNLSGEDDRYLYFMARTPGFSPFAITCKKAIDRTGTEIQTKEDTAAVEEGYGSTAAVIEQEPDKEKNSSSSQITPGFEIVYAIVCLLGVFLYKGKSKL